MTMQEISQWWKKWHKKATTATPIPTEIADAIRQWYTKNMLFNLVTGRWSVV